MREWVWISFNTKGGISWLEFLDLTMGQRQALRSELNRFIEKRNE